MKTIFNIFVFALALMLVQACGSKSKENASERADAVTAEVAAQEKAALDKQAALEKRRAAQQERIRIAAEKRAALAEYYKDEAGDFIYNRAEVSPSFPGGEKAMRKYFFENLKYPTEAQAEGWEGTVYVEFVVGKDGVARFATITEETDEDTNQLFKNEAIRVVDNMPKWEPGKHQGKPVRVKYNLPIVFKLG